jgi:hypothetical protein
MNNKFITYEIDYGKLSTENFYLNVSPQKSSYGTITFTKDIDFVSLEKELEKSDFREAKSVLERIQKL